jgi:hypothetical protein
VRRDHQDGRTRTWTAPVGAFQGGAFGVPSQAVRHRITRWRWMPPRQRPMVPGGAVSGVDYRDKRDPGDARPRHRQCMEVFRGERTSVAIARLRFLITGGNRAPEGTCSARALHRHSVRAAQSFYVAINTAAIPKDLPGIGGAVRPRSAVAFHRRAKARAADASRQADGGTLFLDEIGAMPPDLQVRTSARDSPTAKTIAWAGTRRCAPMSASSPRRIRTSEEAAFDRAVFREDRAASTERAVRTASGRRCAKRRCG